MKINEVIKNMEEAIDRTSCVWPKETPEMLKAIKELKAENENLSLLKNCNNCITTYDNVVNSRCGYCKYNRAENHSKDHWIWDRDE